MTSNVSGADKQSSPEPNSSIALGPKVYAVIIYCTVESIGPVLDKEAGSTTVPALILCCGSVNPPAVPVAVIR